MTRFRGCIDIHQGQVKQIVGGTLTDKDTSLTTNFVSNHPSPYYARLYADHNVAGCHVIKLGSNQANDDAAKAACAAWPGNLQVGGGITIDNAMLWLDTYHASHVIVTSWLFSETDDGAMTLDWDRLAEISTLVGKDRLVVDLSCRKVADSSSTKWVVAMNKWQTLTSNTLDAQFLQQVSQYCCEFLVHAADVEGLCNGIDEELVRQLGEWCPPGFEGRIVYAGGAKLVLDLDTVQKSSQNKVDLTFGSALDIFGGNLVKFDDLVQWNRVEAQIE